MIVVFVAKWSDFIVDFAEDVITRLKELVWLFKFFGLVVLDYLVLALWYTIAPFLVAYLSVNFENMAVWVGWKVYPEAWEGQKTGEVFPVWWFSFLFLCFLVYISKPHPPEACISLLSRSFFVLWTLKWVQTPISPLFLDWFGSKHSHRGHMQSLNKQVLVHCTYCCQTNASSNLLTWLIFLSTS